MKKVNVGRKIGNNKTLEKTVTMKSKDGFTYCFNLVKPPMSSGFSVQNAFTNYWYPIIVKNEFELKQYLINKGWKICQ